MQPLALWSLSEMCQDRSFSIGAVLVCGCREKLLEHSVNSENIFLLSTWWGLCVLITLGASGVGD